MEKYPIKRAGLFGSVVRGEDGPDSDVDILVEYIPNSKLSLFTVSGIRLDLIDKLDKKVDLVEYKQIKPHYKPYIIPYEVRIYE